MILTLTRISLRRQSALNDIFPSIMQHCSCHNPLLSSFFCHDSSSLPLSISYPFHSIGLFVPVACIHSLLLSMFLRVSVWIDLMCLCLCQNIECVMFRKLISCNRSLYYKLFLRTLTKKNYTGRKRRAEKRNRFESSSENGWKEMRRTWHKICLEHRDGYRSGNRYGRLAKLLSKL